MSTQGVGTYKLNAFWESGRLIYYEKAYGHTTTGDVFILGHDYVQVGDTANDVDFKFYGTGSLSAIINSGDATLTLLGIATLFGADDVGVDVTCYGATSGTNVLWDASDDRLELTNANVTITNTTAAAGAYTGLYTTITTGLTHTGNVAGMRSIVQTDNTGDSIANIFALMSKAMVRHESDVVTGTMTGLLAQIDMGSVSSSNACNAWGICIDHLETGTRAKIPVAFIRFTDQDYAGSAPTNYLFDLGATGNEFPTGTGKIHYGNTLWIRLNGADKYLLCGDAQYGWNMGASGSEVSYTAGAPLFTLYGTAAGSGTTNCEPFYMYSILTGTSPVGGRARFHTYTNVVAGAWVNAIKGLLEFGASGRTTGIASGVLGELTLNAATNVGTYACFEAEISGNSAVLPTSGTGGFFFCNGSGTNVDAQIDSLASLFVFGDGLDAASGKFIDTDKTALTAYGGIRIYIEGVGIKYLAVVSA